MTEQPLGRENLIRISPAPPREKKLKPGSIVVKSAKVDQWIRGRYYVCDLCYVPIIDEETDQERSWIVHSLAIICALCMEKWDQELSETTGAALVNKDISLVPRGYYAEGREEPPSNKLGGRYG